MYKYFSIFIIKLSLKWSVFFFLFFFFEEGGGVGVRGEPESSVLRGISLMYFVCKYIVYV